MVKKMTVEIFVRIVWTVFAKIKKVEKWLFFGHFWVILALFVTSQQYEFDEFPQKGP